MSYARLLSLLLTLGCFGTLAAQSSKKFYKTGLKQEKALKFDAAISSFSRAIEDKPANYDYRMARARTYEKMRKPEEAVKDYTEALNINYKNEKLHIKVIDLNMKLGRFDEGLTVAERLLTLERWNIDGLERKAFCLIMLKRFKDAQATCDLAMERNIYNHTLHYYKGLTQDSLKDRAAAVQSYTKAIKLMRTLSANEKAPQPKFKPYYYNLAVAQDHLKQFDESLKNFDQALSMDVADTVAPKNYIVLYQRSFPNYNKSEFTAAINDLNKGIVNNPKEKILFLRRAYIYKATSQYQSAINDCTVCLKLDDKDKESYITRGQCYLELNDYKNAVADLSKSVELDPLNSTVKAQLERARKMLYESNRESDAPTIKVEYPQLDNGGFVNVYVNQQDLIIEGEVRDRSALEFIRINGVNAEIKTDDRISTYTCRLPLGSDVRRVEIVARDVYNNQSEKVLKVGRILDESRQKVTFAGKLLADDNLKTPYSNRIVYLTNEKGEIMYSARTGVDGSFSFKELPYDRTYLVTVDAKDMSSLDPNLKRFILANEQGRTVAFADAEGKGKYIFRLLASDPTVMQEMMLVDDAPLRIDMSGRLLSGADSRTPVTEVNVQLVNERSETVASQKTDLNGGFRFSNLKPGDNYSIRIDNADAQRLPFSRIVVTDERGRIIKEIMRDGKGEFFYQLLPAERTLLSSIAMTDPWLKTLRLNNQKKELTIIENIYYESGAWTILPEAEKVLQKAVDALKNAPNLSLEVQSFTDSQAGDEFNLDLSQKRANAVVEYITSKGVDKKRLVAKGLGETQLVNNCANGVDCSDAEHRQNRRTVFKLSYTGK